MNESMMELLRSLGELRLKKDKLKEDLKKVESDLNELQPVLVKEMQDQGVSKLSLPEFGTFYIEAEAYPSIENSTEAFGWLRANGYADVLKETVHYQTLRGLVNERLQANLEVPAGVKVFMKTQVILRSK